MSKQYEDDNELDINMEENTEENESGLNLDGGDDVGMDGENGFGVASSDEEEVVEKKKLDIKKPLIAVGIILAVAIIGVVAVMFIKNSGLKMNKVMKKNEATNKIEVIEETTENIDDVLARIRGEETNVVVESEETKEEETIAKKKEVVEEDEENVEEIDEEEFEDVIDYHELTFTDMEGVFTVTSYKVKEEVSDGTTKVDVIAKGSISGLGGTFEMTLPYSEEWKKMKKVDISYKMAELSDTELVIIDLKKVDEKSEE